MSALPRRVQAGRTRREAARRGRPPLRKRRLNSDPNCGEAPVRDSHTPISCAKRRGREDGRPAGSGALPGARRVVDEGGGAGEGVGGADGLDALAAQQVPHLDAEAGEGAGASERGGVASGPVTHRPDQASTWEGSNCRRSGRCHEALTAASGGVWPRPQLCRGSDQLKE